MGWSVSLETRKETEPVKICGNAPNNVQIQPDGRRLIQPSCKQADALTGPARTRELLDAACLCGLVRFLELVMMLL